MPNKGYEEVFEGRWYAHPPMRNALIAGALTTLSFVLAHLQVTSFLEIVLYIAAILIGGKHWIWEGHVLIAQPNAKIFLELRSRK